MLQKKDVLSQARPVGGARSGLSFYPLYEQTREAEKFPDQFYTEDNTNYNQYKILEQRIFNNRNKIVQLQQIL